MWGFFFDLLFFFSFFLRPLNNVDRLSSQKRPAAIVFQGRIYVFFSNSSLQLCYTSSVDGVTFPTAIALNYSASHDVEAAIFNNKMYVSYSTLGSVGMISTVNGLNYTAASAITSRAVAGLYLAVALNKLCAVWVTLWRQVYFTSTSNPDFS
jgi:hypothetical protein